MFPYKSLYAHLGNLFYAVAYADGKISKEEKNTVASLVQFSWRHLEESKTFLDEDPSNVILFQFDLDEEAQRSAKGAYKAFQLFFTDHQHLIGPHLKERILASARRIAESTRGINDSELQLLMHLRQLLAHPVQVDGPLYQKT